MKDMANGNFNAKQVNIAENNSEIGANVINGGIDNRKQTIINKPPVSQIKYKEPETYRPQNVVDYFADTQSPNCKKFKKYCKQHLNIETNNELTKAWDVMKNRKRNFGNNPNPNEYELSSILEMSYYVLDEYIQ